MTLDEFYARPKVSTYFPLVFKHGGRWLKMTAKCAACDVLIDDDDVRGEVRNAFRDTFIIDADGYCQSCRKLSKIDIRLMSDLSMVTRGRQTGDWMRWEATPTLRGRLRQWNREMGDLARLITGR